MPLALFAAFVVSLGVHAAALFGTDFDLSTAPEAPPLQAEIRLPAEAPPVAASAPAPAKPARKAARAAPRRLAVPAPVAGPAGGEAVELAAREKPDDAPSDDAPAAFEPPLPAETMRFPAHGMIRFRVERGDQGFEIGQATHTWEIAEGRYRLTALTETSGLIAFFKPLRIELESRGRVTAQGFRPEIFLTRRDGRETGEKAEFDWDEMRLRIGAMPGRGLVSGTQDLLTFHYQLAFLPDTAQEYTLPIASGKKFEYYRLEVVGDEEIDTPAGHFRTLHLRAPGNSMTELWLAREHGLLPVKIRHVDRRGDSFVQVATEIGSDVQPSPTE